MSTLRDKEDETERMDLSNPNCFVIPFEKPPAELKNLYAFVNLSTAYNFHEYKRKHKENK